MPRPEGFQSEEHRRRFALARQATQGGGAKRRLCDCPLPGGKRCRKGALAGEKRCLRHGGPHAARRHRQRQLDGLRTGRVTPAEFARAEARRARNALQDRWKNDPRIEGATIDLGENEWRFAEALERRGIDLVALFPAVADWLRWRWQRTQIDAQRDREWTRICREDLPKRIDKARHALEWTLLGRYRRGSAAGKLLHAVWQQHGFDRAEALAARWATQGINPPPKKPRRSPLTALPARPWKSSAPTPGSKRRTPDAPPGRRPRDKVITLPLPTLTEDQLAAVLGAMERPVLAMFSRIETDSDRIRFAAAFHLLMCHPDKAAATRTWVEVSRPYAAP